MRKKGDSDDAALAEEVQRLREQQRIARQNVNMLRSPVKTLYIFCLVILTKLRHLMSFLRLHLVLLFLSVFFLGCFALILTMPGKHEAMVEQAVEFIKLVIWWVGLGVLSSIGLGTGLHTFVLYLGPYIAQYTLAATECNTTALLRAKDGSFACPSEAVASASPVSLWAILRSVQLEAFLWGAGTAIGELPPYFVARAARLSGDKLEELEALGLDEPAGQRKNDAKVPTLERLKRRVYQGLQSFGFLGILLFASIPNPLFDLAGLMCGHFLIPFYKFFGATFIGKAVIKVSIQSIFVITVFSQNHLQALASAVEFCLPFLSGTFTAWLENEKKRLHETYINKGAGEAAGAEPKRENPIKALWEVFIALMVAFFLLSIVNSTVQHHLANQDELEVQKLMRRRKNADEAPVAGPSASAGVGDLLGSVIVDHRANPEKRQ
eukprot:tig00001525_g9236.t1